MYNITSPNYASSRQPQKWVGYALIGGLTCSVLGKWGPLSTQTAKVRFLVGGAPFSLLAGWTAFKPFKEKKEINGRLIQVQPSGKGSDNPGFIARTLEGLVPHIFKAPLYPEMFNKLQREHLPQAQDMVIESPQAYGYSPTLLLIGQRVVPSNFKENEGSVALLFAGNGERVSVMSARAKHYLEKGIAVQLVDWRSFGDSEGSPNVPGTHLDTEAMVGAAMELKPKHLIFHGISLGAHHAAYGAAYAAETYGKDKVFACYMEQPFGKLEGAAENVVGAFLAKFVQWFFPYDNMKAITRLLTADPKVLVRITRGKEDKLMNPKGCTNIENPESDRNVEPIFQAIKAKKGDSLEREDVILDQAGIGHCKGYIWSTKMGKKVWQDDIERCLCNSHSY